MNLNSHAGYEDEEKTAYKCVDPDRLFFNGTYTQLPIGDHFKLEAVHKCGLAMHWCDTYLADNNQKGDISQIFIWQILTEFGYHPDYAGSQWRIEGTNVDSVYQEFNAWFNENKAFYAGMGTYWENTDVNTARPQPVAHFWATRLKGKLLLEKTSTLGEATDNNPYYSLRDARYQIWCDENCTQAPDGVPELVTNDEGTSNVVELDAGRYWIKETKSSKGFHVNPKIHLIVVNPNKTTTAKVTEEPRGAYLDFWASKCDSETGGAQGLATLEGAEFTFRYYPGTYTSTNDLPPATRTWVIQSDHEGKVRPSGILPDKSDDLYFLSDDETLAAIPFGTITIQETKAPTGYYLEGQNPSNEAHEVPLHIIAVEGMGKATFTPPTIRNEVKRGGISLQKADVATGNIPQGDASFAGVQFQIINRNTQPVVVQGKVYQPGEALDALITTNEQGEAATSGTYLPVGTYEVREVATNASMLLSAAPQIITISDAQANTIVPLTQPFKNEVVRGGVTIPKVSRETQQAVAQGAATLKDAIFGVILKSGHPISINGVRFQPNDVVTKINTNNEGIATSQDRILPYGTYEIRELQPPTGYLLNEAWSTQFSITHDGEMHVIDNASVPVQEQVIRGGFQFNKVDAESMERLASVVFRISSRTTGEQHIVVTDENGVMNTEAAPHSHFTNKNDMAIDAQGVVNEAALDPHAGVWFNGSNDASTPIDDSLGALPYDTYDVDELASSANEGKELVSFVVHIASPDRTLNMGTIYNKTINTIQPSVVTKLTFNDTSRVGPVLEQTVLTDIVQYENLTPGKTYRLKGRLVHKEDGTTVKNAQGEESTGIREFEATEAHGETRVSFELDSSKLAGTSVVAYEELYDGDTRVAQETSGPEDQTIAFPTLKTSLTDKDGRKEVPADKTIQLVDHVTYSGLETGRVYEIAGTLIDADTKEPVQADNNLEVKGIATITPSEPSGTAEVVFTLDGATCQGKTIVAYEQLLLNGTVLVRHENPNDEQQTVTFPHIQTTLLNTEGHKVVYAPETTELVDTVSYRSLQPLATYELVGSLVNKDTGEVLRTAQGDELTVHTTIKPDTSEGTAYVTFPVEGLLGANQAVVAFETLLRDGKTLASHEDITSEAQTVYAPLIATLLTDKDKQHEVCANDRLVLIDTVTYKGLRPGIPYTLAGTLMNAQTGEAATDAGDKEIVAKQEFTPAAADGSIEMSFTFNASSLAGTSLVAFETLHEGSSDQTRVVATHEDLSSAEQTVSFPILSTTATDDSDGDKTIPSTDKATIKDTVTYKNLTPHRTYLMRGTVMDKETAKPLKDANGKAYTVEQSFTPDKSEGVVVLAFAVDSTQAKGNKLVVFETCFDEKREVASHNNLEDDNQTITIDKHNNTSQPAKGEEKTPQTSDVTLSSYALATLACVLIRFGVVMRRLRH